MKFEYSPAVGAVDSSGKQVKRPILELRLMDTKGNPVFNAVGVIDSGADTTVLNVQYAAPLGIDLDSAETKEIIGVGEGRVTVKIARIRMQIRKMNEEVEIPAWFVNSSNVNILLGQEGFFDAFRIKFEKDHDVFEVYRSHRN